MENRELFCFCFRDGQIMETFIFALELNDFILTPSTDILCEIIKC